MSLDPGKLRHRVTLRELAPVLDSAGDPLQDAASGEILKEWQDRGKVWAAIEPLSAREFIASGARQVEIVARITIRFRSGIVAQTWRVEHGAAFYNVEGVLPDKDSGLEYLTLPVSTGVNEGGE